MMFIRIRRSWREWRAKVRLTAPLRTPRRRLFFAHDLLYPDLRSILDAGGPELPPYRGLANFWDDHVRLHLPDYPSYLRHLAHTRGLGLRAILDLACGTGRLTERLTDLADEVVGVDASPDMLAVAETRRGGRPGVRFAAGDFRRFDLGREFDAAVCASNSLNYVADRRELSAVFAAVGRHLRPGGVFVFDTTTEPGMWALSGLCMHAQVAEERFAVRFSFDSRTVRETAVAVTAAGVETHRRIPIGPADVRAAVAGTGLAVDDHFTNVLAPWHPGPRGAAFFLLTRRD